MEAKEGNTRLFAIRSTDLSIVVLCLAIHALVFVVFRPQNPDRERDPALKFDPAGPNRRNIHNKYILRAGREISASLRLLTLLRVAASF